MVKPGYKETIIGILPEKWDISELKNIFTRIEAGVSVNSDNTASSDYYVLKTSAVHNGMVDLSEIKPVIQADYSRLKCSLQGNSIIFSRMNTPDLVGECGYNAANVDNIFLPDRLWKICNTKPSQYNFQWLNYLLNTVNYRDAIRATATGTSNSMKNISKDRLLEIKIPVPPIDEQQKIAEALSDMDSLIASLKKLIAKKKAIKRGTMQELLTGKKRLPGSTSSWRTTKLDSVCSIQAPMVDPRNTEYSMLPHIGNESIEKFSGKLIHYNLVKDDHLISGKYLFTENEVLYGKINPQFAKATYPRFMGLCSADMYPIKCSNRLMPEYLLYILLSEHFTEFTISLSRRSGIPKVNREEMLEYQFSMPPISEQQAIASILSGMDSEISALEQKLAKCRQTKQGMMQQLLTGKIRLV